MYALFYEYVEDIVEKRAPFREEHLARLRAAKGEGLVLMGGAVGDPPHGALIIFDVEEPRTVEDWAAADPYVTNDLVTSRRVERWNVV